VGQKHCSRARTNCLDSRRLRRRSKERGAGQYSSAGEGTVKLTTRFMVPLLMISTITDRILRPEPLRRLPNWDLSTNVMGCRYMHPICACASVIAYAWWEMAYAALLVIFVRLFMGQMLVRLRFGLQRPNPVIRQTRDLMLTSQRGKAVSLEHYCLNQLYCTGRKICGINSKNLQLGICRRCWLWAETDEAKAGNSTDQEVW